MNKILWVCHFLPYPSTGHGALQRTHHLVRQAAKSFDVHLFVIGEIPDHDTVLATLGVKSIASVKPRAGVGKAISMCRSLLGRRTYWEHLFYHRALHAQLKAMATEGPCSVVLDTAFLAPYTKDVECKQLIVNHHNIESALLAQRASRQTGVTAAMFRGQASRTLALEVHASTIASQQWVVSREDELRLRAAVDSDPDVRIVPNGVDVDYFSPLSPDAIARTPKALVFAGGMDWYPNNDAIKWLAEEIWPALTTESAGYTMTIVGKSPPAEAIELARRDSRIEVTGFVPDIRPYIHQASAYLCPIRQGGGTRLKILDALALGCPLVATGLAVDGLLLQDGVHFLQADDPAGMASALLRLSTEPGLADSLVENGRRHVIELFSWDYIGTTLVDFLSKSAKAD